MPRRPCLGPAVGSCPHSALALPGKPRCSNCETSHQHKRNQRRSHYQGDWPRLARQAIANHLATYGPVCPGWQRPSHTVEPSSLTADHINPRSLADGIGVLCRGCNARKGNRDQQTAI